MKPRRDAAACASMARMTARALAAATTAALALGGLALSASEAKPPAPKCKVVSTQTQTRDITGVIIAINPTRYGNGTQERTMVTSRCHGERVVTYTAWE